MTILNMSKNGKFYKISRKISNAVLFTLSFSEAHCTFLPNLCLFSHAKDGTCILRISVDSFCKVRSQWTNIVAWQQMPTFWGIAANL